MIWRACIAVPRRWRAVIRWSSPHEGRRLLEQIREVGHPLVVLTGGDPIKRPDICDFIAYGDQIGLRMTITPLGTPLMTPAVIDRLKAAGLVRMAVSLDGSTAAIHDAFRQVHGSFDWSVNMLRYARRIGLSTQVNTTVTRCNFDDFDRLCALMVDLGIDLWSVFFLVVTGRGRPEDEIDAAQHELVFAKMYELSKRAPFDIKSTVAPPYRRFVLQQQVAERRANGGHGPRPRAIGFALKGGLARAPKSVNDGNGFVFISHLGEVFPSGFLPISAGNVRCTPLSAIYRDSELFRRLRDYAQLKGKCGVCEFREVCGGSRARAYGVMGDYLESDPYCAYVPPRYAKLVARGEAESPPEYFQRRMDAFLDDERRGQD
ncbi:MAG TPA: radical SAM protein [Candidatus Acidoferrales bacterium]|nr:radical SAM protein [Candidatus Acidoferrales bacterium]